MTNNKEDLGIIEQKDMPSCEEQLIELSELVSGYMDQYVYFKDMIFDLIDGKITINDAKTMMYGYDRGYDQ